MRTPLLQIVATPIGNLDDMTPRARRALEEADLIAAEDTRHSRRLLTHFGIKGQELTSLHDYNEEAKAVGLIDRMVREGLVCALVSDAGTPCVSDPGYRLVAAAHAAGVRVEPVAGASALTAIISAAGLPTDRVLFVGFLPPRAGALRSEVASWAAARSSVVFYESTRRLGKALAAIHTQYPDARIAVGRELTKLHEEIVVMDVGDAVTWASRHESLRGEAVVMVDPRHGHARTAVDAAVGASAGDGAAAAGDLRDMIRAEAADAMRGGASVKDLLSRYRDCGLTRSELYQLLLDARASL